MNSKIFKDLGVDLDQLGRVSKVSDLLKHPPGMCLVDIVNDCSLYIGQKSYPMTKGTTLCMSVDAFLEARKTETNTTVLVPHKHSFSKFFNRYRGQNLNNKTLLIWRSGGIGDVIFSQPIVKNIRSKYPKAKIVFATNPDIIPLLAFWPIGLLDSVTTVPFTKEILTDADYHLTFEGCVERCDEARTLNYYALFKKMSGLKFNISDFLPQLCVSNDVRNMVSTRVKKNTILLQFSTSSQLKDISPDKWASIIEKFLSRNNEYNIGIIDSPNKSEFIDKFIQKNNFDVNRVYNLSSLSSNISMGVVIADLCVGGICLDSSFVHILSSLGKPVLGLYGPFDGKLTHTYYPKSIAIDPSSATCPFHPCYLPNHMKNICPQVSKKEFPTCLMSLNDNEIVDNLLKLMEDYNV